MDCLIWDRVAISCLGAFQPPVIGARGEIVLAGG
jgi:hypothetical protein